MRLLLIFILSLIFFGSCTSRGNSFNDPVEKISRDTGVTPKNSSTRLFLDSIATANFFAADDDTLKARVRNFYNARNYEFAWFSETGLTPQAEGFWTNHEDYFRLPADSSLFD